MRCKLGDLAIVVRSNFAENLGAIVEIISGPHFDKCLQCSDPVWEVKANRPLHVALISWDGTVRIETDMFISFAHDNALRPIRPDSEDKNVVRKLYEPSGVPFDVKPLLPVSGLR